MKFKITLIMEGNEETHKSLEKYLKEAIENDFLDKDNNESLLSADFEVLK